MKPPAFTYHCPATVEEALRLLGSLENAKVLAGGQSLMPMLNLRFVLPDHIVDINRIDGLAGVVETNGALEIGAMTRQRDVEFSPLIGRLCPMLQEAIVHVGHRQTRNRGTIGGSLCHFDPAAELAIVAAALDAEMRVSGGEGDRILRFDDFALSFMTTAIAPDELLVSVRLPVWPAGHGHAFVEFSRRHGDFAMASAAALVCLDQAGRFSRVSLTIGGACSVPVRLREVEAALVGRAPSPEAFRIVAQTLASLDMIEDAHAPAAYRRHLAATLVDRALSRAVARAEKV